MPYKDENFSGTEMGEKHPLPLTGGVGCKMGPLGRSMRSPPKVSYQLPDPEDAKLVAWGWDSVQESWDAYAGDNLQARFDTLQSLAQENAFNGKGVVKFDDFGEPFLMHASGAKGGVRWRIENDDFILLIKSGSSKEWGVSVRYRSAGLWEHHWEALHDRIVALLDGFFECGRHFSRPRVTRADWAFDIYAPEFRITDDLYSGICAHPKITKSLYGHGESVETVTVGSPTSLQMCLYDKTREITVLSGKTWMHEIWARNANGMILENGVWRIECRLGKGFLRNRNCRLVSDVRKYRSEIVREALVKVRLTDPNSGAEVRHRDIHPLWALCLENAGLGDMLPLGRRVTGRREESVKRSKKQLAGALRSVCVLENGTFDQEALNEAVESISKAALNDPENAKKVSAAKDRYELIDEAR